MRYLASIGSCAMTAFGWFVALIDEESRSRHNEPRRASPAVETGLRMDMRRQLSVHIDWPTLALSTLDVLSESPATHCARL